MEYKVIVATGTTGFSGTTNCVYVTLVGENGQSERTLLDKLGLDLGAGAIDEYKVRSSVSLGRVFLVRLEKQKILLENNWFCSYIKVTLPGEENVQTFPCYHWFEEDVTVDIREGTAKKLCDENLAQEVAHRKAELQERQKIYRWKTLVPGIPKCIDAKSANDLPQDIRLPIEKIFDLKLSKGSAISDLQLKTLVTDSERSWKDLEEFKEIFWNVNPIAEYTMKHWREDRFFGYQFLNGTNPLMIKRCRELPSNFCVSGEMVQGFLSPKTTLDEELKAGNIYIVDYAILDGVKENVINGKKQFVAAPLCLLYEHPKHGLIPIAIQLEQNPTKNTPIFLPSDPDLVWLLAKMWVRSAEFQVFEVAIHLLKTHLIVEVFCVATLRHLPGVHPIYKLLIPHLKYTLEINTRARTQLISQDGILKKMASTGGDGLMMLIERECKVLTYRSFQPHCDFEDRGVFGLRNYFFRDHSLMLWNAIKSFVSSIVSLYYKSDIEVEQDSELQAWIKDVVEEGLEDLPKFGLSNKLKNIEELITLLSVLIFTSSAQHAALNNGQYDYCGWVPNTPCTMRQPPPKDKKGVTMDLVMKTLPDVSQSSKQVAITWLLGRTAPDAQPLGHYKDQHFTEPEPQKKIERFKLDLKGIEEKMQQQKKGPEPPYLYLYPSRVENSITA